MSGTIPLLRKLDLEQGLVEKYLYSNLDYDLFWTESWDPEFYIELAKKGFISVCVDLGEKQWVLIPELQTAYAVLDWANIHVPKSFFRYLRSQAFKDLDPYICLRSDCGEVIKGIRAAFAQESWLHPPYEKLIKNLELYSAQTNRSARDFHFWALECRLGSSKTLVAGELGYSIGSVYTSLSGFMFRNPAWNNLGKFQLYALAGLLQKAGYRFWNLGHPHMQYKLDLGASVLDRLDFLDRWLPAIQEEKFPFGSDSEGGLINYKDQAVSWQDALTYAGVF